MSIANELTTTFLVAESLILNGLSRLLFRAFWYERPCTQLSVVNYIKWILQNLQDAKTC